MLSSSIAPGMEILEYKHVTDDKTTRTGTYSTIEVKFLLKRQSSYYILVHYVPILMCVIISMISFWINTDKSSVARIFINLIMVVFVSLKASYINDLFPPVAYTKVIL